MYLLLVTVADAQGLSYYGEATPSRLLSMPAARLLRLCWLEAHPLSTQQIFQRLREIGYRGGLTIVKTYVHRLRPPKQKAYLKLSFAGGECAQVDWGVYGSTRRRLSFFVMVQCYSRLMYVDFTVSQTVEHFLGCHERAFAVLGLGRADEDHGG
jgi:transposase